MAEGVMRNIWDVINHVKVDQPKLSTENEKQKDGGDMISNIPTIGRPSSLGYGPSLEAPSACGYDPLQDDLPVASMDTSNSSGSLDDSTIKNDMCAKNATSKRSKKTGAFTCDICGDHLATRSTLKNHRARRHGQAARFECSTCGHRYNNRGEYQDHVDGHNGVRRHKCDTCDMTFTHKSSQSAHKKVCKGTNIIPSLNVIRDRLKFGTKKQATKQEPCDDDVVADADSGSRKSSAPLIVTRRFDIPVLEKHELLLQKQIKSHAKKSPPKKQSKQARTPRKNSKVTSPAVHGDASEVPVPAVTKNQVNGNTSILSVMPAMKCPPGSTEPSSPQNGEALETSKFTKLIPQTPNRTKRKYKKRLVQTNTDEESKEGVPESPELKIHIMSCLPDKTDVKLSTRKRGKRNQAIPNTKTVTEPLLDDNQNSHKLDDPPIKTEESVVIKVSNLSSINPSATVEESQRTEMTDAPLDLSTARSTPSPCDVLVVLPVKTERDDQPLDLSVRRPLHNDNYSQSVMETCASSTNNLPVSTASDAKPKSPNIRVQNSIFNTFSVSGLQGRKVSPVRPHIRGKPVRNLATSLVVASEYPYSKNASASPSSPLVLDQSTSGSHEQSIGSNANVSNMLDAALTQSRPDNSENSSDTLSGSLGFQVSNEMGDTSLKIKPTSAGFSRKRTYQETFDASEVKCQNGHSGVTVLSVKNDCPNMEKRSPLKHVTGVKRSIPTAHVKPNQLELCSVQDAKSEPSTVKHSSEAEQTKDLFQEIYDTPPLLEESVRALSSSLESISDTRAMPVLSPHRDGLRSPNSTLSKSDNLMTSPPTLMRLSPLPGITALSNIVSDTETSTCQSRLPVKDMSRTSDVSSDSACPLEISKFEGENSASKLDLPTPDLSKSLEVAGNSCQVGEPGTLGDFEESFKFVQDDPAYTKSLSTWCETDDSHSSGMIAFDYCPWQVKRYRMDISNTRYYTQVVVGTQHDVTYDHTTQRNIQESAFPKMQLTDDWRKDQVTYKINNLRVPKKLITMPEKTPPNFMQGIEKFFPKIRFTDSKVSKTMCNRNNSMSSEAPKKRRSFKAPASDGTAALTKSPVSSCSTEEAQNNTAKGFVIKLVKLSQISIRKALTALKVPNKCETVVKTEYDLDSPTVPVDHMTNFKTNQRILDILRRGGVDVKSENKPSTDNNVTDTFPQRRKRRSRKRKLQLQGTAAKPAMETGRGLEVPSPSTVMSSTPLKDGMIATLQVPMGTSPIRSESATAATPPAQQTTPSPKKSPRRSPRSPRSPRKFSADRWIFPAMLHRSRMSNSPPFSGEYYQQKTDAVDPDQSSARRNLSNFGSLSPEMNTAVSMDRVNENGKPQLQAKETKAQKRARQKKSLLDQLASSEGYIADKQQRNENLLVDPSQLNREERALQRALMKITEMEIQAKFSKLPYNKLLQSPKKSSCTRKADELKKKARRVGNQTAMGKTLKQKYEDFRPLVLGARTRLQATGREDRRGVGFFHKDLAYEQALTFDEQRKKNRRSWKPSQEQAPTSEQSQSQPTEGSSVPEISPSTAGRVFDSLDETIDAVAHGICYTENESGDAVKQIIPTKVKSVSTVTPHTHKPRKPSSIKKKAQLSRQSHFVGNQYTPQIEIDIANDSLSQLATAVGPPQEDDALSMCSSATGELARLQVPPEVKKLNVCRDTGETVLHKAARMAYLDIVEWCCKTRYVDVRARDYAGFSALHETCVSESVDTARCLLQYGAEVNVASRQDGIRPLHDAIERDNFDLVRLFLSWGADPTLSTYSGRTALQIARTEEMHTFLLTYLADLNGNSAAEEGEELVDMERVWRILPEFSAEEDKSGRSGNDPSGGCSILADVPADYDESRDVVFHISEDPLITCYLVSLKESCRPSNHVLLWDLMCKLHKSENEFRIAYPEISVQRCKTASITGPDAGLLRKAGSKKALALVPYESKVMEALNIEKYFLPAESETNEAQPGISLPNPACSKNSSKDLGSNPEDPDDQSVTGVADDYLDAKTGVLIHSPLRDQNASTVSFCEDAVDDALSQDLEEDDEDDHLFFGDCKGCSSPELSENEEDELPFNDYTTCTSSGQDSEADHVVVIPSPKKSPEEQKPTVSPGSGLFVSLLSRQTVLQPSSQSQEKIILKASSNGPTSKPSTSIHAYAVQNNNTAYLCPSRTTPKPLFILSPNDHLLASSLASEGADAPSRLIPWELHEAFDPKKPVPGFAENMFQDVREPSPQTVISSGAGSETETTSENEYGLKIAQVCSLSASDAKNVFGSDVELP